MVNKSLITARGACKALDVLREFVDIKRERAVPEVGQQHSKMWRVSIQSISWRRWAYALRSASRSFSTCCSRPPLTRTNMSNRSRDTRVSFIFSPSAARRSARFTCPELPRLRGLRAVLIQHRQRSTASEWRQQMAVPAACHLARATYAACTRSSREPFECAAVVCERECS